MPLAGISDPFLKYQLKPDTELDVRFFFLKPLEQCQESFESINLKFHINR
jgi:hypothetical protein